MKPLDFAMKLYDAEAEHRQQIETRASLYLVIISTAGAGGASMLYAMPDDGSSAKIWFLSLIAGAALPYALSIWHYLAALRNDAYVRLTEAKEYLTYIEEKAGYIAGSKSVSAEHAEQLALADFAAHLAKSAAAAAGENLKRNMERAAALSISLRYVCAAILLLSLAFGAFTLAAVEASERVMKVRLVD